MVVKRTLTSSVSRSFKARLQINHKLKDRVKHIVDKRQKVEKEIMADLKDFKYQGFVAIEPHVATVFHAKSESVDWQQCYQSYVDYGRALEKMTTA